MINRAHFFIIFIGILLSSGLYYSLSPSAPKNLPDKTLTIYTWIDFIPPKLQKEFEAETGIKLRIDYIDSDEGLEAKLLTGKAEYDLVYPSTPYVFRHIKLGLYRPLSIDKLSNLCFVDKEFLRDFKANTKLYSVPYLWGTSGFAYDKESLDSLFPGERIDSWDYFFNPEKLAGIAKNGVSTTSSGNELFCAIGFWKGYQPHNQNAKTLETISQIAMQARPYWRVFLSSESAIHALGSGEVSIAFMWNGDALAAQRLSKLRNKKLEYVIPKEGALKWIDGLAIPHNAPNADAAHTFINFLLQPEHMAAVTNYVHFSNTSSVSKKFIRPDILNNHILYPDEITMKRLSVDKRSLPEIERTINRLFFKILVGY
jgi:putrescine transport system substrate-binding protein